MRCEDNAVEAGSFSAPTEEETVDVEVIGEVVNVEVVYGSAEVSKWPPDVRCEGKAVGVGSVFAPTEEEKVNVVVVGEVANVVLIFSFVFCGGFRGSSMHTSVQADHCLFEVHLMRLEVPAFLTSPSMQLWRKVPLI